MGINVRTVNRSDITAIFSLMHEATENTNHGPKMSLEDLYRDGGFDDGPTYYFAYLAEDLDIVDSTEMPSIIGFVIGSYMYSWDGKTMNLNSLVVKDSHQFKGVEQLLFKRMLKHAKETKCNRIEFIVFDFNDKHDFYREMGALNVTQNDKYLFYRVHKNVINDVQHG